MREKNSPLNIDGGSMFDQKFHNFLLTSKRCNVQSRISFLGRRIDNCTASEELLYDGDMSIFGCEMECV